MPELGGGGNRLASADIDRQGLSNPLIAPSAEVNSRHEQAEAPVVGPRRRLVEHSTHLACTQARLPAATSQTTKTDQSVVEPHRQEGGTVVRQPRAVHDWTALNEVSRALGNLPQWRSFECAEVELIKEVRQLLPCARVGGKGNAVSGPGGSGPGAAGPGPMWGARRGGPGRVA